MKILLLFTIRKAETLIRENALMTIKDHGSLTEEALSIIRKKLDEIVRAEGADGCIIENIIKLDE